MAFIDIRESSLDKHTAGVTYPSGFVYSGYIELMNYELLLTRARALCAELAVVIAKLVAKSCMA